MILDNKIELSVLDFGETNNAKENVQSILNYAVLAEHLGYKRFWMGEHYGKGTYFSNPEPLVPVVASLTKKISVGVAGLLIRQHSIQRLAYSFNLLEAIFLERIDLGLVAPKMKPEMLKNTYITEKGEPQEIFKDFINFFSGTTEAPGISIGTSPNLWHLTSSIKSYISCQHDTRVNVSKTLFHHNSNFEPEIDEINRLKDKYEKLTIPVPKITIAIACYVSYNKKKISEYKKKYQSILSKEVYNMCIIENPKTFLDKIYTISKKYQTTDIIILNLGHSYEHKSECLETMSEILKLKNAY